MKYKWINRDTIAAYDINELVLFMRALLRQLTKNHDAVDRFSSERLKEIVRAQDAHIATVWADDERTLIGMGMIFFRHEALRVTAFIGEVVVDELYRRRGYARAINENLIVKAREKCADFIELTSNSRNPLRAPAISLYKSLGFVKPKTTYFRLHLPFL